MAAAAVTTINPVNIPGLGKPLCEADMAVSCDTYNSLPNIENQVRLYPEHVDHVKALLDIIGHHSMGHLFRIHSAHRHGMIPSGTVRLEAEIGTPSGFNFTWNRATIRKNGIC